MNKYILYIHLIDMIKFLNKRKKDNRQSLIIDNLNIESLRDQFVQRRNSLSESSNKTQSVNEVESLTEELNNTQIPHTDFQHDYNKNDYNKNDYNKNDYNKNDYNKNDYNKNDYNKNDYNKNDYNKNDYNKNDYNKNDYNKNDYNKNDYNKNDYNKNDYNKNDYNKNNNNNNIGKYPKMERLDKPIVSGFQENEYYNNSSVYSFDNTHPVHNTQKRQEREEHKCNICYNTNKIKDSFMILTCGHIFHIRCLVDSHYNDANKCGVIDEDYLNSRICSVCSSKMEMEDILYIHNKFYKNTKEYIVKQDETIDRLDKQMSKLKEELRICYEYKQKLEHQREKSRQITITLNTIM
jgi:hypothetical protein